MTTATKTAKKAPAKKAPAKSKAKQKTVDVLANCVMDKSGSMSGLVGATIEGFNSFLADQRALDGKAYISLTLFDTEFDVRFVATDVKEVPNLGTDENPYFASGMTALYDAVVTTIRGTEEWLRNHKEFTGKVITVILTDGGENSSRTSTLDAVNALITEKTKLGWEFVFMGAGQAAWTEGKNFASIPQANRIAYAADASTSHKNYDNISRSLASTRTGESMSFAAAASVNSMAYAEPQQDEDVKGLPKQDALKNV